MLTLAPLPRCSGDLRSLRIPHHHPSRPFPGTGADAPATHKLEEEEQVRESGEDREAAGQGAATRRRCGGHAGVLASASGLDARGPLACSAEPGGPGAPARGLRVGEPGAEEGGAAVTARPVPAQVQDARRQGSGGPDPPGGRAAGLRRGGREMDSCAPPPGPPPTGSGTESLRRGASHALHGSPSLRNDNHQYLGPPNCPS